MFNSGQSGKMIDIATLLKNFQFTSIIINSLYPCVNNILEGVDSVNSLHVLPNVQCVVIEISLVRNGELIIQS